MASKMAASRARVAWRAHFRDGRLLLDEFGHPILQSERDRNEVRIDSSSRQVFSFMRSRSSACHHLNMRTRTSVLGFLIASSRGRSSRIATVRENCHHMMKVS